MLDDFIKKFTPASDVGIKQPMNKNRARQLIDTRMRTGFTRTQCLTLRGIVDGLQVNNKNWREIDVHEANAICPTRAENLAAKAQVQIVTLYRSLKVLLDAGLIFVAGQGRHGQNQYSVNLTQLEKLQVWSKTDRKVYQHKKYIERKKKVEATQ